MNVCVFGAGYVGLVQGAILADVGNKVICVDVDEEKVKLLTQGVIPIFEPGLSEIIVDCVNSGNLIFTTNAKEAVEKSDIIFIAVGTPPDEDGSADLKHVLSVAKTIGNYAQKDKIVVTKSTVPVGTSDKVSEALKYHNSKHSFDVVSNPEFLKEGSAVSDCQKPDRIIIGSSSEKAISIMSELYSPFCRNHSKIVSMDVRSAEMTKYAANCMLATKISFMNEMANIAEVVGADIEQVRLGIGSDPRIGFQFIYPGCGFGGSCFPKDVKALIKTSSDIGVQSSILNAVEDVNDRQKMKIIDYVENHYKNLGRETLSGLSFAIWGLSFKPNTDDIREAPSLYIIEYLLKNGATVNAYDPEAMGEAEKYFSSHKNFHLKESPNDAVEDSNALLILTEWKCFRAPNFEFLKSKIKDKVIFDGRNLYSPHSVESAGISYYGIGRGRSVNCK